MLIIKGKHAVSEALTSNQPIRSIIIADTAKNHPEIRSIVSLAKSKSISIAVIQKQSFIQKYSDISQSIIAEMPPVHHHALSDVLSKSPQSIVICDHIEDPYNFGAIIRTSVAMGVDAIIYPKDRQVSLTSGVIKASSGALYKIPLVRVTNIRQTIDVLKKHGLWVYGTDVHTGESCKTIRVNSPFALIIGNESNGMSKQIIKYTDGNIRIPISNSIESLNVSVATGILLYSIIQS